MVSGEHVAIDKAGWVQELVRRMVEEERQSITYIYT
jgi:hypothetical protein